MRTARDEITTGTEHWRSDEWKEKGRVAGAKLKPDLAWLRRDTGDQWKKVVVDVKVTSTDKMNEAFKEKDEKYPEWATKETREKKVVMAVMAPLIVSHDGAVHKDTVWRRKNLGSGHPGGLCNDGAKRAALQCGDCREILQQRELGLRGMEERESRGMGRRTRRPSCENSSCGWKKRMSATEPRT